MKRPKIVLLIFLVGAYMACESTLPTGVVPGDVNVSISYVLTQTAAVNVSVYNSFNTLVRVLVQGQYAAGTHTVIWDKTTVGGSKVPDGIYYAKIAVEGREVQVQSMVLASSLSTPKKSSSGCKSNY
jgi:flagellar hook assembly protein FlgD